MGSTQPSSRLLSISNTNLFGSTDIIVPKPLHSVQAPIGELNEKFCGSRDSYDISHCEQ